MRQSNLDDGLLKAWAILLLGLAGVYITMIVFMILAGISVWLWS